MSFGNLAGPISAGALLDAFGGSDQGAGPYKPAIVSLAGPMEGGLTDRVVPCRGDDRRIGDTSGVDSLQYQS